MQYILGTTAHPSFTLYRTKATICLDKESTHQKLQNDTYKIQKLQTHASFLPFSLPKIKPPAFSMLMDTNLS